jgi:hypothetical protein
MCDESLPISVDERIDGGSERRHRHVASLLLLAGLQAATQEAVEKMVEVAPKIEEVLKYVVITVGQICHGYLL